MEQGTPRATVHLFQMDGNMYYVNYQVREDGWHRIFSFDVPSEKHVGDWFPPDQEAHHLDFRATQQPLQMFHESDRQSGKTLEHCGDWVQGEMEFLLFLESEGLSWRGGGPGSFYMTPEQREMEMALWAQNSI